MFGNGHFFIRVTLGNGARKNLMPSATDPISAPDKRSAPDTHISAGSARSQSSATRSTRYANVTVTNTTPGRNGRRPSRNANGDERGAPSCFVERDRVNRERRVRTRRKTAREHVLDPGGRMLRKRSERGDEAGCAVRKRHAEIASLEKTSEASEHDADGEARRSEIGEASQRRSALARRKLDADERAEEPAPNGEPSSIERCRAFHRFGRRRMQEHPSDARADHAADARKNARSRDELAIETESRRSTKGNDASDDERRREAGAPRAHFERADPEPRRARREDERERRRREDRAEHGDESVLATKCNGADAGSHEGEQQEGRPERDAELGRGHDDEHGMHGEREAPPRRTGGGVPG